MPERPTVLEVENLSVHRGRSQILFDVSWTVRPGEHWAIMGPNGCGKTSLLNVLMGYLTASSGLVEMPGRADAMNNPGQRWDSWRRRIGFVSSSIGRLVEESEPAFDVVLAGRFAMVNYWRQETDRTDLDDAWEVLDQIHCRELADLPWAYLSQGERQRMLIGRALMSESLELLILDEPCAGLDPVARETFLKFVDQLAGNARFRSLVLVTHHVEEILPSTTHVLLLKEGKVLAAGPKREILTSENLSEAFGAELRLERDPETGRFGLTMTGGPDGAV